MTRTQTLIEVENLSKTFGGPPVLENVTFRLKKGDSLVIIGGSGTGKSVLIKCILGLLRPSSGKILIHGTPVQDLSASQWQTHVERFGMLFQGGALFDSMTVWENVAFALIKGHGMPPAQAREVAVEKLCAVNLSPDVAKLYPAELSGGMQKRVALARAIAHNPEVIFFDEPTTGLDPITSGTINDLILKTVRELGASAITITHDMESLRKIADRVGLLYKGRLVWTGSVKEMDETTDPYVHQFINGLPTGPFTDISNEIGPCESGGPTRSSG